MTDKKEWILEGAYAKAARMAMGMSRHKIKEMMGVSYSPIINFEEGRKIRRRHFVKASYYLAIEHEKQRREIIRLQAETQLMLSELKNDRSENCHE